MSEQNLFTLSEFNSVSSKNIFVYEAGILTSIKERINKRTGVRIREISANMIPTRYIQDQFNVWDSLLMRKDELEEFYQDIYSNTDFENTPGTTIPVYDVSEIKTFRPQYLDQFVRNSVKVVEQIITTGKTIDVKSKFPDKALEGLCKSLVAMDRPIFVDDKDFITFNNRIIVNVNSSYITTVLLPFIRSSEHEKKELVKSANVCCDTIDNCTALLNSMISVVNGYTSKGEIDKELVMPLTYTISVITTFYIKAVKYLVSSIMRKIYIFSANLKEYATCKDSLIRTFTNGTDVLHESVIDGNMDFDDAELVNNLLSGRSDCITSVHNKVISQFRAYLSNDMSKNIGDDMHSLLTKDIKKTPFDIKPYNAIKAACVSMKESIGTLEELTSDPDLSIEELSSKSKLDIQFTKKFSEVLSQCTDVSFYLNLGSSVTVYEKSLSILHELQFGDEFFKRISEIIRMVYENICNLRKALTANINDEFPNGFRNSEEIQLLDEVETGLRQFLVDLMRAYFTRVSSLKDIFIDSENTLSDDEDINPETDATDYLAPALSTTAEIDAVCLEESTKELTMLAEAAIIEEKVGSTPIVFYEDDNQNGGQNQNNTQNNNQQQNSNQNNNQTATDGGQNNDNKNSAKPEVQDNSGDNAGNGNTNSGGGLGDAIKKLVQKIKDFISNIIEKIKTAMGKQKNNLEWLKAHEEGLKTRSYNNVNVNNFIPFDETVNYIALIEDCAAEIDKFKNNPVGMSEEKLIGEMFRKIPKGLKKTKDGNWGTSMTNALRGGENVTISISNGQLKEKIPMMIDFCTDYYSNFASNLEQATNKINSSVDALASKPLTNKAAKNGELDTNQAINFITKQTTTLIGVVSNVARDRANHYITILNSLAPKDNGKNSSNDNQNNDNTNQNDQNS